MGSFFGIEIYQEMDMFYGPMEGSIGRKCRQIIPNLEVPRNVAVPELSME